MKEWDVYDVSSFNLNVIEGCFHAQLFSSDQRHEVNFHSSSILYFEFHAMPDDFGGTEICDVAVTYYKNKAGLDRIFGGNGPDPGVEKGVCLTFYGGFGAKILAEEIDITETFRPPYLP